MLISIAKKGQLHCNDHQFKVQQSKYITANQLKCISEASSSNEIIVHRPGAGTQRTTKADGKADNGV